jgi:NAD(P)-dependent dehydrogenase (short-subunit alcohol dehydrogenase family)
MARRAALPRHAIEEQHMSERVVLVTGALAGIGRATATAFARQGAAVVVSGRRDEEGKAFAAELREPGADAKFLASDDARFLTGQIVAVNGGKTAA